MKKTFAGRTSAAISKHTKSDSMTIFFNNKSKDDSPKPYDILKEFQDEMHKIADDFAEKFPAGTFVKEWYGNDDWNPTFCYISSKPYVDLDETPVTNYNIEQYKKCKGNKDESCISVHYVPISIYNLDNTCSLWWSNSFSLCENRHFEKSSFDEYREYMLNKFKDNVEHFKEQLKRDRELIRDNKRRINRIDKDMGKAIEILNKNYEIAIKKLNK